MHRSPLWYDASPSWSDYAAVQLRVHYLRQNIETSPESEIIYSSAYRRHLLEVDIIEQKEVISINAVPMGVLNNNQSENVSNILV